MNTLHLSVINDGATYEERIRIARMGTNDAYKLRAYQKMCADQAELERRQFGIKYRVADINDAAQTVMDYMLRHVSELS